MGRKVTSELQVLRVEDVRDTNETRFLHLIRDQQPISQIEVVQRTGLRPGTVSVVINRLLKAGFLYEAEHAPSKGGRRAVYLQVNAEKAYAIAVSIGVCETMYAISDFNGRILSQRTLRTSRTAQPFLQELGREIADHVKTNYGKARFSAVGVSVPGLLNQGEGNIIFSPNLGWSNVPVKHVLEQQLNLPVMVENDSNAAALSELWYGPLEMSSFQSLLFVLVIDGIGTGFILNGELHIGSSVGSAGFGHMTIDLNGPLCSCGNHGCLEAFASDPATVGRFLREHPAYSTSVHSVHDIVGLAVDGRAEAREALEKTAAYLGTAIRGLAHGLSPEVIVVGGQITEAWSFIEPVLRRELHSGYLIEGLSLPQLRRATVERPPLFGAIPIALRNILKNRRKEVISS